MTIGLSLTTKQAPQVFTFIPGIDIRVAQNDGRLWFLAMDVCAVLDLRTNNVRPLLDSAEVCTANDCSVVIKHRGQSPLLVSESGLYKMVLKSRKPEAKTFRDWITGTVLPAIRKDGGYIQGEEKLATEEMSEDEFLLKALQIAQAKVDRYKQEAAEAKADAAVQRQIAAPVKDRKDTVRDYVRRTFPGAEC